MAKGHREKLVDMFLFQLARNGEVSFRDEQHDEACNREKKSLVETFIEGRDTLREKSVRKLDADKYLPDDETERLDMLYRIFSLLKIEDTGFTGVSERLSGFDELVMVKLFLAQEIVRTMEKLEVDASNKGRVERMMSGLRQDYMFKDIYASGDGRAEKAFEKISEDIERLDNSGKGKGRETGGSESLVDSYLNFIAEGRMG
jgi:hypothetical protein